MTPGRIWPSDISKLHSRRGRDDQLSSFGPLWTIQSSTVNFGSQGGRSVSGSGSRSRMAKSCVRLGNEWERGSRRFGGFQGVSWSHQMLSRSSSALPAFRTCANAAWSRRSGLGRARRALIASCRRPYSRCRGSRFQSSPWPSWPHVSCACASCDPPSSGSQAGPTARLDPTRRRNAGWRRAFARAPASRKRRRPRSTQQ